MRKTALGLALAIIAGVALVSASGAAITKSQEVTRIDVSTRAAVIHYLRSIHVKAKGVVIQRGALNYAGSHCPGSAWTCASTRHTVVQIAKQGGVNRFVCRTSHCAVVQFSGVSRGVYVVSRRSLASTFAPTKANKASCIRLTGLGASCSITQSSATNDNQAFIYENAGKLTGLTQSASYTASITQKATGASNSNTACVTQAINIDGTTTAKKGTPVTVTLEAHQSVTIRQDATGNGTNSAVNGATSSGTCDTTALGQNQTLSSTANGSGPITQLENDAQTACPDGNATPDYANLCLDIEQNQGIGNGVGTGPNKATFTQTNTLTAVANTSAGAACVSTATGVCVSQTQSSANGGLLGTINQDSAGVSTASATQTETQCEDAHPPTAGTSASCDTATQDAPTNYSLSQQQFGPVKKGLGTATQTGNGGDTFQMKQSSNQDNDLGGNTQTNTVQGDCNTSGNCTDTQTTNIDGTPSTNTQAGSSFDTTTSCTGSSCTPTCTGSTCTTFSQSGAQLTAMNTEVKEFGYGGMRGFTGTDNVGDGTGSIAVSGINGPVTRALLYWNGPTNSSDPNSNANVSFDSTPIIGTNIGTAASNCWGLANGAPYTNSQSYEADVTTLVSAGLTNGSGTFGLANFIKRDVNNNIVADINGVSLVVFYNDGQTANFRNVVLWSGNDSNVADENDTPDNWNETLTGVPWPGSGSASLDFIVGDGQNFGGDGTDDGAISVNGHEIVPAGGIFQGDSTLHGSADASGDLWDVKSYPLPSSFLDTLTTGSNPFQVTAPYVNDCLSLVAVAANMPASAPPVVLQAPIHAVPKQAASRVSQTPATVLGAGTDGFIRRK